MKNSKKGITEVNSYILNFRSILLLATMSAFFGCGDKDNKSPRPSRNSGDVQGAATQLVCDKTNKTKCPKLTPKFSGLDSLDGNVDQMLSWNITASASEDIGREYFVTLHEQSDLKSGMEVRSSAASKQLLINWKPEEAESGTVRFRARDMTRCGLVSQDPSQCTNMQVVMEEFDTTSNGQYKIQDNEEVDATANQSALQNEICSQTFKDYDPFDTEYFANAGAQFVANTAVNGLSKDGSLYDAAIQSGTQVLVKGTLDYINYYVNKDKIEEQEQKFEQQKAEVCN